MIILVLGLTIFALIYTKYYNYDFIYDFVKGGFDLRHIIIIAVICLLFLFNVLLNLQLHQIDKKYFNRYFVSEEEFHSQTRKKYLFNSVSRLLLVLISPIFIVLFFYLIDKIGMIPSELLRVVIYVLISFVLLISIVMLYVTDILMPLDLLLAGEIGFGSYCRHCRYGSADAYRLEKKDQEERFVVYKCVSCGNEMKVEKFRHVFIDILKKIHLHK